LKLSKPNYMMSQLRRQQSSKKSVDFLVICKSLARTLSLVKFRYFVSIHENKRQTRLEDMLSGVHVQEYYITYYNHKEHPEMGKDGSECTNLKNICSHLPYPF
jgi:hypothetical protein